MQRKSGLKNTMPLVQAPRNAYSGLSPTLFVKEKLMRRKSNRAENDFEAQKEALLKEVRSVLGEVESLYEAGVERGEEEARELTAKLKQRLSDAQAKFQDFEERAVEQVKNSAKAADEYINDKPYYAMGFAALAGLVVGVLLNRR